MRWPMSGQSRLRRRETVASRGSPYLRRSRAHGLTIMPQHPRSTLVSFADWHAGGQFSSFRVSPERDVSNIGPSSSYGGDDRISVTEKNGRTGARLPTIRILAEGNPEGLFNLAIHLSCRTCRGDWRTAIGENTPARYARHDSQCIGIREAHLASRCAISLYIAEYFGQYKRVGLDPGYAGVLATRTRLS